MTVREQVAHILFHVNAEMHTSDSSQTPGVQGRGQKILDLLEQFKDDRRTFSRPAMIGKLKKSTSDTNTLEALNLLVPDDDGQRIRLILASWVGKGKSVNG